MARIAKLGPAYRITYKGRLVAFDGEDRVAEVPDDVAAELVAQHPDIRRLDVPAPAPAPEPAPEPAPVVPEPGIGPGIPASKKRRTE